MKQLEDILTQEKFDLKLKKYMIGKKRSWYRLDERVRKLDMLPSKFNKKVFLNFE